MMRKRAPAALLLLAVCLFAGCDGGPASTARSDGDVAEAEGLDGDARGEADRAEVDFDTPGEVDEADGAGDGDATEPDLPEPPSRPILSVDVEDGISYRLSNAEYPHMTGDLWPCAWGADGRLYTSNGDGLGFGDVFQDIMFSVLDGSPPDMSGSSPPGLVGADMGALWPAPYDYTVNRKPTGLVCLQRDIYLFYQNLKNFASFNEFGEAPQASISVTHDSGQSWVFDTQAPMFSDHVFTTGFFLDYGQCQQHARDRYVYVYGMDYNWRFSRDFSQTRLFLARVPADSLRDRSSWEFFAGSQASAPVWTTDIDGREPVLEDESVYCEDNSAISQGSVVYIPELNRYLYSSRAICVWIFYEAAQPWGPWTKVSVIEWVGRWTEQYHAGYNAVIPTKFLDNDGLGGWIVTSLSGSRFDGMYYNMGWRRFELEAGPQQDGSAQAGAGSSRQPQARIIDTGPGVRANGPIEWVAIPAGSFEMGCSPDDEDCSNNEEPRHAVQLPSFEMTRTEITQAQFEQAMGSNPSYRRDCPDCPVERVGRKQAREFCTGLGGRLPAEAEWEYAARAGTDTTWACGQDPDCLADTAWYNPNARYRSRPAGSRAANAFGLHDMYGNVAEWIEDCWQENYENAPADGSAWEGGPDCGIGAVRGAGFFHNASGLRASNRTRYYDPSAYSFLGFRCAR